jgi:hypothetical protein
MNVELRVDGETVVKMDVNASLLLQLLSMDAKAPFRSAPLTQLQAKSLLARIDQNHASFLKRIAENDGWVSWGETKQHFGVKDWRAFERGPGGLIDRALREVTHHRTGRLVWRNEEDWKGLDEGADEVCNLLVDGAALVGLREALGL